MCTKVENCTAYDSEYDPCNCTACEDGYIFENGACVVDPCIEKCKIAYPLFAGQDYTNAAIDQIGNKALAAYATHQFYVGDKNGDFGQGKWYLPSIGEWIYFYGTDTSNMTSENAGITGDNKTLINDALNALATKGVDAAALSPSYYWSSSENGSNNSWMINGSSGNYGVYYKNIYPGAIRCSQLLKNIFNPSADGTAPKVGDVMYEDKTWGLAADYDGSKKAVGIVSSVSRNGRDATIINLRDLTFSSPFSTGNFNPNNPYGGAKKGTYWSTELIDITGIQNFDKNQFLSAAQASGNCPCQLYKEENSSCNLTAETCVIEGKIFNAAACACESCPSGYLFDNEINECREVCRKGINDCAEYDSEWADCKCTACEDVFDGYLFE